MLGRKEKNVCLHESEILVKTDTFICLFTVLFHLYTYRFRVFRDILKSMPPVLDIFTLLLFFMVIFAILGTYSNKYVFSTIKHSSSLISQFLTRLLSVIIDRKSVLSFFKYLLMQSL